MKETTITMFYPDALTLVFGACDSETQKAIAHTSREWHRIMFNIRENKARATLKLIGPYEAIASEKSLQQQCSEKMQLLDQRAKRLADWFSATPPDPKYTGKYIEFGLFGGGPQIFSSYASYDLDRNVFHDKQLFPHIIIDRAIQKFGLAHSATCPLDTQNTSLLEVIICCSNTNILKSYLEHFHTMVCINVDIEQCKHPLDIAAYERYEKDEARELEGRLTALEILAEYGAALDSEGLGILLDDLIVEGTTNELRKQNLKIKLEHNATNKLTNRGFNHE